MFLFNELFIPDTVITSACLNTLLPFFFLQTHFTAAHMLHVREDTLTPSEGLKLSICLYQQGATGFHIHHRESGNPSSRVGTELTSVCK